MYDESDGPHLCLFGVVAKYHGEKGIGSDALIARFFDISYDDACALEDGFEDWLEEAYKREPHAFHQLGREIALQLEEEAGLT